MANRRKKKRAKYIYARPVFILTVLIFIVIFGISIGLLELYQYIDKIPYFQIKQIKINGCDEKTRIYILQNLKLTNIFSNIFFFNTVNLEKKLEINPWIKSVKIKKKFPNALIINIKKEKPYALIVIDNDIFYVDNNAYIFKKVIAGEYMDLPVITGITPKTENFKDWLKKSIEIINIIKNIHLYPLSEIHITKYGNVHLFLCDQDVEVVLSHDIEYITKKNILKKLERLKKVLNYFSNYGAMRNIFIDLDCINKGAIISLSK